MGSSGDEAMRNKSGTNNPIGVPHANSKYAQRGATPAGFFAGIWHGFIAPISQFVSLGNPAVRTHEARNTGRAYIIGYRIGAADPYALEL
jgi:hypothetical protein